MQSGGPSPSQCSIAGSTGALEVFQAAFGARRSSVGCVPYALRVRIQALEFLLQAVGLAAPGGGLSRFGTRRSSPFSLAEPSGKPANKEPKGEGAQEEHEQGRLDSEA